MCRLTAKYRLFARLSLDKEVSEREERMPTTHTWNGTGKTANGYLNIYNQSLYTDGQPFQPGDTLVVNGGGPAAASNGGIVPLTTGTYLFNPPSSDDAFYTDNVALDASSVLSVSGPGKLNWLFNNQFVNNGSMQFGSPLPTTALSRCRTTPWSSCNRLSTWCSS